MENFSPSMPYLRVSSGPLASLLRRRVDTLRALGIGLSGGALRRLAREKGIPVNHDFCGIYDLSANHPYGDLFRRFLIGLAGKGLVMCHPGHVDDALRAVDSLTDQRQREFDFLSSEDFSLALEEAGVRLSRFQDC